MDVRGGAGVAAGEHAANSATTPITSKRRIFISPPISEYLPGAKYNPRRLQNSHSEYTLSFTFHWSLYLELPTLLYTKFLVPQKRREAVARPELVKTLRSGLKRRLLLVSAPPGYGKTTLLVEFVSRVKMPLVWYQLDSGDGDPIVFLTYLTEGLARAVASDFPTFGTATNALLNSAESQPAERVLAVLLNELARLTVDVLVVLEDYHHIQNPALHTLLDRLIEQAPPTLHVLISSRSDPPLSLARWRARQ